MTQNYTELHMITKSKTMEFVLDFKAKGKFIFADVQVWGWREAYMKQYIR